jgi:hypothetical protein
MFWLSFVYVFVLTFFLDVKFQFYNLSRGIYYMAFAAAGLYGMCPNA